MAGPEAELPPYTVIEASGPVGEEDHHDLSEHTYLVGPEGAKPTVHVRMVTEALVRGNRVFTGVRASNIDPEAPNFRTRLETFISPPLATPEARQETAIQISRRLADLAMTQFVNN